MNLRSLGRSLKIWMCLLPLASIAQNSIQSDTAILYHQIAKAKDIYTKQIGVESHLLNGVAYKDLKLHDDDEGHPFFTSNDWIVGTINYNGDSYINVSIQYELLRDKVIIEHPYSFFKLELIPEKINSFTISGHTFVRLLADTNKNPQIKAGLFELLYDGNVKVYAKRTKNRQKIIDTRTNKNIFGEKNQYYIYKNGVYYSVKSKGSVLKVFNDRKAVIKKDLAKNKIRFGENRELALSKSAKLYDESAKL